ncbi:MAG: hypothetical protein CMF62_03465 [Magnetococcales bacterium]|nr:hypothetical protein [Magnetococcales bacterium]
MELPNKTKEQKLVTDSIKRNNIIVDSVAGSGKTTTNLHIAKQYTDKKILLVTYNKKLKIETREKIQKYKLKNIEVHSYHSFCVKYYYNKCYTDSEIKMLLNKNLSPLLPIEFDILIIR